MASSLSWSHLQDSSRPLQPLSALYPFAAALAFALSLTQGCPEPPRLDPARPAPAWQSRAVLLPRPSAPAPSVTAPVLQPLLLVLRSLRAPPARLASPPCPRLAPRLPTHVRLPPGCLVRHPLAPLRPGGATVMSDGGAHAGMRNGPCGARFSLKIALASPRGRVAMTPSSDDDDRNTSNSLLLLCASPSSRLCCCLARRKLMRWSLLLRAGSPRLRIPRRTTSSCRNWAEPSGPQPSARVDVYAPPLGPFADRYFREGPRCP